jgi:hypothetical protein
MNKIIISFATVSCFALGATFAHAAENVNYYKMYDPHGVVQTAASGAQGVIHSENSMKYVPGGSDALGAPQPGKPIPPVEIMTHPGHSSVDGA